jgi:hypothetical protein
MTPVLAGGRGAKQCADEAKYPRRNRQTSLTSDIHGLTPVLLCQSSWSLPFCRLSMGGSSCVNGGVWTRLRCVLKVRGPMMCLEARSDEEKYGRKHERYQDLGCRMLRIMLKWFVVCPPRPVVPYLAHHGAPGPVGSSTPVRIYTSPQRRCVRLGSMVG